MEGYGRTGRLPPQPARPADARARRHRLLRRAPRPRPAARESSRSSPASARPTTRASSRARARTPASRSIDALARALELDDDERAHLHRLARPGPAAAPPAAPARDGPAEHGPPRRGDGGPGGRARPLHRRAGLERSRARAAGRATTRFDARPNLTRMLFLDRAHTRELHRDWDEEAASRRRLAAARAPDASPTTASWPSWSASSRLKSAEFAALWSRHPVANLRLGRQASAPPGGRRARARVPGAEPARRQRPADPDLHRGGPRAAAANSDLVGRL